MKNFILGLAVLSAGIMNAQTQIIAHRGYFQTNPPTTENSLKSLENAQNLKIYGAEFDVRMTKDGVLVVNHDEHHAKMEISETDFKELKKVKLSNGEQFPTLKDYLKKGKKDQSLKLIVEIKPDKTKEKEDELTAKTIKMIKDLKLESQSEFISFSLNICKEIKKLEPSFKVQYLRGELSPQQIKDEGLDGIDYHYSIFEKNPTWIAEANALGLITNSWTVNDIAIFNKLKDQGIGFVTTNTPADFKDLK
ncbi:glycerophosphodiester phosphodiesterase family protein [Chryseobacterium sp. 09-1422]|jgi:glycerophosphoryl diester phosphodiesterase|uniref:Glycerophosphodiester phosphodiesterase family protein n=1 Tax=Chryseobacterium kimseyorum TaxID=2984028 RepID=A0ABT3I3E4_9FLAO|nr:glycerophosphodiester phosphodiesterase family protein [Chryseobacterium kimseyorum]MCW3170582.1 glycerophosphodiester phosphodiesterase family protein [Chryseobacterium kimseyorum]